MQSLPPGDSYPAFQAYPRQAVDLHLRDRDRIAAEEEALQRRRRVVAELEERSRRAEVEGARWAEERKRLAEIEAERRGALRRLEVRGGGGVVVGGVEWGSEGLWSGWCGYGRTTHMT